MSQDVQKSHTRERRPRHPRRAFHTVLTLAVLALLAAVPALAQPGHGPGHHGGDMGHAYGAAEAGFGHGTPGRHMGRLIRFLDLTEAQKESAEAIFEATLAEVEPIREARRERHQELRTLLDGDSPEAGEVGSLVIANHAARDQVRAIHEAAFAEFKDLLTVEQLEKLERFEERRDERRNRRHGGHRGPGGGGFGGS